MKINHNKSIHNKPFMSSLKKEKEEWPNIKDTYLGSSYDDDGSLNMVPVYSPFQNKIFAKTLENIDPEFFNKEDREDVDRFPKELRRVSILSSCNNDPGEIDIIYTGDIHGAMSPMPTKGGGTVGGIGQMASVIKKLEDKSEASLTVDVGDWGQGSLESNMSQGKNMLKAMNAVGYDAVAVGNHEFDWGRKAFEDLLPQAEFPVLGANILKEDGKLMDGLKPYVIKKIGGMKVAVIGVLTDKIKEEGDPSKVEGLTFKNSIETVKGYTEEVRKKEDVDLVVVLSHQGDEYDDELAKKVKNVVIIGGHSHKKSIKDINGNIIVKSGTKGKHVGHLHLVVDKEDNNLSVCYHELVTVPGDLEPDPEVAKIIAPVVQEAERKKEEVIGSTDFDLDHNRLETKESTMGDFVTDVLRKAAGADLSFIASSELRDQIFKGEVDFGELYRVLPRDDSQNICIDLTGAQVKNIMENSAKEPKNYLQASGISLDMDRSKPLGSMTDNIKINGKPLDPEKSYRVVINDILVTGPCGYDDFTKGKNVEYGGCQRDIVLDYIKENSPLTVPPERGRLNYKA